MKEKRRRVRREPPRFRPEEFDFTDQFGRVEKRYRMVDTTTGLVVDDDGGEGYYCEDSARDAWQYKCMSEDERLRRPNGKLKSEFTRGLEWLRGHPNIHENMDDVWFHMLKGSYGEGVVFDVVHICWIELHGTGAKTAPVPCLLYGFVSSLNCVPISPVCCDRI